MEDTLRIEIEKDVECYGCGSLHDSSEMTYLGSIVVCSDCEPDMYMCDNCGTYRHVTDMEVDNDGDLYCDDCSPDIIDCIFCNDNFHDHKIDDYGLCPICQGETVMCYECEDLIHIHDSVEEGFEHYCVHCHRELFEVCYECGDTILREYALYDGHGDSYCEHCYSNNNSDDVIKAHNYRADIEFYGNNNDRVMGVELEIDGGGSCSTNAQDIIDIAGDHRIHAMHDGSLRDGFELVSQPMTLDYHENEMPWEEILHESKTLGYKSHNAGTCGIHVHMNRGAFSNEDSSIMKILFFIERNWSNIVKFSRRTESQLDNWASRYCDDDDLEPYDLLETAKRAGKYRAVNLNNRNTVEIRLFRGTLKYSSFIPIIQFCDTLYDIAELGIDEVIGLSWEDYKKIATKHIELAEYMEYRGI